MSTSTKKATRGIRYSDTQKKEIVDFAIAYNAANGRGGQSKAAEKFNISPITLAAWLKAADAPTPKKSKAPKESKTSKKVKAGRASRYTDEQKKEVIDFAAAYNAANGRGGQSKAAAKFKISPLTVMAWLKAAGVKSSDKADKSSKAKAPRAAKSGNFDAKLSALLALSKQIAKAESELAQLNAKFKSLKASL